MQTLIDALLALARSDQGAQPGPQRLLDLDEIGRLSAARVAKPPQVTLRTFELDPTEIRGNEDELVRIVDNLLANAYRHARSSVELRCGADGEGAWLTVDDDGDGVPPESRETVFDRFVRLDEARDRDRGGSGLGLALARAVAVTHGGLLFIADSHLGGASFVLRLPLPTDR